MKIRTLILLIILVALLATFLILKRRSPQERHKRIFSADSTSIGSIEIAAAAAKLVLVNDDGEWKLTHPVRWNVEPHLLRLFFSQVIGQTYSLTPLAQGSEAVKTYRLEQDNALQVKLFDFRGKLLDHVWFSNLNNPNDYFRFEGSNKVFQIRQKVAGVFTPDPAPWRSPYVLSLSEEQLSSLEVKHSKNSYTLTRSGDRWTYKDSNEEFEIPPRNTVLIKILHQLTMLGSYTVLEQDSLPTAASLGNPECVVKIKLMNDKQHLLEFFKHTENYLLRVDSDASRYFVVLFDNVFRFTRKAVLFRAKEGYPPPE